MISSVHYNSIIISYILLVFLLKIQLYHAVLMTLSVFQNGKQGFTQKEVENYILCFPTTSNIISYYQG